MHSTGDMLSNFLKSLLLFAIVWKESLCAAPLISGLPAERSVGELETDSRIIYQISATDPDGDAFACSISSVIPYSGQFEVWYNTFLSRWTVNTIIPRFDYATIRQYIITIACNDISKASEANLTVKVVKKDLLQFTNLPVSTTSFDAFTTVAGTTLYTVLATSELNSGLLSYSITPTTDFSIDGSSGNVTNNDHLKRQITSPVDLWVTVSDGTIIAAEHLRINIHSNPLHRQKSPPSFFYHNYLNVKGDMFSTRDQVTDAPIPIKNSMKWKKIKQYKNLSLV